MLLYFEVHPFPHFVSVSCQRSQTRHRQGMKPKIVRLLMVRNYVSLVLSQAIGQFHVEIFADGLSDVNEAEVRTKIKKSGGADYDQGSNAGGSAYTTSAGDIKAQAKGTFLSKEKETNIGPVIFEKSALPQTTPIDLKGRPMVAPPTEAMRNVNHTGNLDVDKFQGKVSVLPSGSGGDVAPAAPAAAAAPAPAPASAPAPALDPKVLLPATALPRPNVIRFVGCCRLSHQRQTRHLRSSHKRRLVSCWGPRDRRPFLRWPPR